MHVECNVDVDQVLEDVFDEVQLVDSFLGKVLDGMISLIMCYIIVSK